MRLAYLILLIVLMGCIQLPPALFPGKQYQNETAIEPPEQVPEQPELNVTTPETKLESYLTELGFTVPWDPKAQDYSWISSYETPGCTAELEYSSGPCFPQTNEEQGYVNITWCPEEGKKYKLATKCAGTSAESLKFSLLSSKKNITSRIMIFSPERMSRLTVEIDEQYDWGKLKFVYTNHGKYPEVSKITELDEYRVFCVDNECTKMFIFLQNPAKYLLIETELPSQTQLFLNQFINKNPDQIYSGFSFEGLGVFKDQFAYNHGVKIFRNQFGITRAEPVWFEWKNDLILSDSSPNIHVYSPLGYFRDPQFWLTQPTVIGSQIYALTGEFNNAKTVDGKYSLCFGLVEQCTPACDKYDSLIVGNCPDRGAVPLQDDLQKIFSFYDELYNFTSFKNLYWVTLLDGLGEQHVAGEQKTGQGMVLSIMNMQNPLTIMVVKGDVEKEYLKSILDLKFNFDFQVVRTDTKGYSYGYTKRDCTIYRYDNGYSSICHMDGFSIISYTHCTQYTECKSEVDYGVDLLVGTSAK